MLYLLAESVTNLDNQARYTVNIYSTFIATQSQDVNPRLPFRLQKVGFLALPLLYPKPSRVYYVCWMSNSR